MRYRNSYRTSKPTPRDMVVKYPGACVCCGATIPAGTFATYYPAGTLASRTTGAIGHLKGIDGDSQACYVEQCKAMKARGEASTLYPDVKPADRQTFGDGGHDAIGKKAVSIADPGFVDPGELAEDRWNETHGDRY